MAIFGLYVKDYTGIDIFKDKSHLPTLKAGSWSPQWCYKRPLESIMLWSALISIVHCSAACCTLCSRKIQCKANNRFSLNNPLTQKSELSIEAYQMDVSLNYFFPSWFFGMTSDWEQKWSWSVVYCREFRSTIKSGLKVCWMLLNTFQIYLKTNSNCFRDKYANGRKT